jgi:prevent-host-death family protein
MADVEEIGTRELHRRLSEVLDRAASGEVVRVTSHGKPKALILPPVAERWLDVLLDEIRRSPSAGFRVAAARRRSSAKTAASDRVRRLERARQALRRGIRQQRGP